MAPVNGVDDKGIGVHHLPEQVPSRHQSPISTGPTDGRRRSASAPPRPVLSDLESATARDQLHQQLLSLTSAEELTAWATRSLPLKNSLATQDAEAVEEAFRLKSAELSKDENEPELTSSVESSSTLVQESLLTASGVDETLAIPKTPRRRDKKHLAFVSRQPCLICGRSPSDAHHLRFSQPRAIGRKVSDEFTVPLCRGHHRGLHAVGNELAWWEDVGIDPLPIAQQLWTDTR